MGGSRGKQSFGSTASLAALLAPAALLSKALQPINHHRTLLRRIPCLRGAANLQDGRHRPELPPRRLERS